MAKQNYADEFLRAIAKEALGFLLKNVDSNSIKCILATGSIANGEGTVIKHKSSTVASDFDFVVYIDFSYYLKNRTNFINLSKIITAQLLKSKIDTHVVFLPSPLLLQRDIHFSKSSIYEYEFAIASKCVFGKTRHFNLAARPNKKDALELTFTVVGDLVFSNFESLSDIEKSYIYAKRALTLLNSLLIFHGYFAETYEKRINIAEKYGSRGLLPLTTDELKILKIFYGYKLSGSLQQLLASLSFRDMRDLLTFQSSFLKNLTMKILGYELNIFINGKQVEPTCNTRNAKFTNLLAEYYSRSETSLFSKIFGLSLFVFWSFSRRKQRKELFATLVFHKKPPKLLMNIIITLLLIYDSKPLAKKLLDEFFPWVATDGTDESLQRIFTLWQSAEESIKL